MVKNCRFFIFIVDGIKVEIKVLTKFKNRPYIEDVLFLQGKEHASSYLGLESEMIQPINKLNQRNNCWWAKYIDAEQKELNNYYLNF